MEKTDSISEVLLQIEAVLRLENQALRSLDRMGVEDAARRKADLDRHLTELTSRVAPRAEHVSLLRRVRRAALSNQLLLVHARSCVQGVLALVSGEPSGTYPGAAPRRAPPAPVRIDVRG